MPARKVSLSSTDKKPSLASLMPDKTKGAAEKKRAVKRIVASASKKTPAKKTISTLLRSKPATTAKKNATPIPTVSVSAVPNPRRTLTKTTPKEKRNKTTAVTAETVVTLPTSISIRAKEKSLVLLDALVRDFHVPAQKVALASGICFITFGGYMALAFSGALPSSITPQTAIVNQTTQAGQTATSVTNTGIQTPTFTVLEPIPAELTGLGKFTISVTNAKQVGVFLYSLATGDKQDVPVDTLVEGTYRFTIDASTLEQGEYVVKTVVSSSLDASTYSFRVGEFKVGSVVEVEEPIATSTASTTKIITKKATSTPVVNEPPAVSPKKIDTLTIATVSSEVSGRTILKAYAPEDTRFVEFFARPIRSTNLSFLGLGEKRPEYWQYFFNSTNLPNGTYELIAKTRVGNTPITSNSAVVTISNYTPVAVVPTEEETTEEEAPLSFEDTVAYDSENTRSFSEYSVFDAGAQASASSSDEQSDMIDYVLEDYREEIQTLLERYAVAQQSGDQLLIEIAKKELTDAKTRLVQQVLSDPGLSILGDDVDAALTSRFEELQKRIETFEELRKVASEESSSADTDADGISDFDEFNLFRTNPEEPDSDNDGVTDGVEVMRGYNPLDATAEAVIVYELPQETYGLVQSDVLKIESVSPYVKTEDPTVAPIVQASIKGKGLPNSYVTIYVFSTPTIVTVRTDQDGSFEYTFEKELEDGTHEVYVAVTDNTGAIMARSNPFTFIKQAQAFTPVDAVAGTTGLNEMALHDIQALDSYNIAIGLGILALGVILLILGSGLKQRYPVVTNTSMQDVHAL